MLLSVFWMQQREKGVIKKSQEPFDSVFYKNYLA